MTKPRITKHSGSPQIADSACDDNSSTATKETRSCPTCFPRGGFHHIECPNQPGGAYNNRYVDWPLPRMENENDQN